MATDAWGVHQAELKAFEKLRNLDEYQQLTKDLIVAARESSIESRLDDWNYFAPLLRTGTFSRYDTPAPRLAASADPFYSK